MDTTLIYIYIDRKILLLEFKGIFFKNILYLKTCVCKNDS